MDILSARRALLARDLTATQLLDRSLTAIAQAGDEAARIFVRLDAEAARLDAARADALYDRGQGADRPLLGIPLSVKDLFDIRGQVSTAGTVALADRPPATADAPAIARLRQAGAILVGRTGMSELAFSGVGINPHYGTPSNPATGDLAGDGARITGGSSSGAAASVGRGMALAGIGSDTGGSVRIPAALCGLTGYKPSQARIPLAGTVPLSPSLDTVGPIGRTVADCALLADVMAGEAPQPVAPAALAGARFLAPLDYLGEGASAGVLDAFQASLDALRRAGATVDDTPLPELSRIPEMLRAATFPGYEGYRLHRRLVADRADQLDPLVRTRFEAGGRMTDAAYAALVQARAAFIAALTARLEGYAALVMPTVPIEAPRIADLADPAAFARANLLLLRNPTVINLLDGCAVTLPNTPPGGLPTGLSIAGPRGSDRRILALARAIETLG